MPNHRPASDDPLELIRPGMNLVPAAGFRWVERLERIGKAEFRQPYLTRNPGEERTVDTESDVYLEFAALAPTLDEILKFANEYGALTWHGYRDGESIFDWTDALAEFRYCFEVWQRLSGDDPEPLAKYFRRTVKTNWLAPDGPKNLKRAARDFVIDRVNRNLREDVRINNSGPNPFPEFTGGLRYEIAKPKGDGVKGVAVRVVPYSLRAAVWLGLSEYVAGGRLIHRCEAPDCGRWMDVTEEAHPQAKRFHWKCGLRHRMKRYRQKLKEQS